MNNAEPHSLQFPVGFDAELAAIRALGLPNVEFHPLTETVLTYASSERVPAGFPHPDQHVVIADYCIDLPVVAVDLSPASEHYGRVLGYSYGDYWTIADSLAELTVRLWEHQQAALYGR